MNRRDFLKMIPDSLPRADQSVPDAPSTSSVTPGSPRRYAAGMRVFIEEAQAWLCCDSLGFYAIDAHCSHLGCMTRLDDNRYACPCHGSHFNIAGQPESGPAKEGLRYLYVDLDASGNLVIRRDKTASPDDRLIA